jgi:hypothetical protein
VRPPDEELIGWFSDAAALRRFGGRSLRWPLDRAQLETIRADPDVRAFTLYESFGFAPTGAPDAEGIGPMARD